MAKLAAGITAVVMGIALSGSLMGCSSSDDTSAVNATAASAASADSAGIQNPVIDSDTTINEYIVSHNIQETPIKPNDPGTPDFDFPFPEGWSLAGDRTPEWAYGAIIYDAPVDSADPPIMYAIASKLTGDVDAEEILECAPSQLEDLNDFTPIEEPTTSSLSGFEAVHYVGTYMHDGERRIAAQKTVVIPSAEELFVLQLNADAPEEQRDVIVKAAALINDKTTITPPV